MNIDYKQKLPLKNRPIYIIGAGGIVRDAHLPAYAKAGFDVRGIYNRTEKNAKNLAEIYHIPNVYTSIDDMVSDAEEDAVFDIALMPKQFVDVLTKLPNKSVVLIQKPMGDNIQESIAIKNICKEKELIAGINCQLRFAPYVNAARSMIDQGLIGEVYDMEIRVTIHTPWEYFPNVINHPRLEIQQHSVHHIDLIRSFFGDPRKVYSKTVGHPAKSMSSTRTITILDYRDDIRCVVSTNHDHNFGIKHQDSFIKWEGTKGAIYAKMGLLMDYPNGVPDVFEYYLHDEKENPQKEWKSVELEGSWFPDAFIGTMSNLIRFANKETDTLLTSVDDVFKTMSVVESAYKSSDTGGEIPQ